MKTGHTILYSVPPQCQSGSPRCSILFGSSILFTRVSYSPITAVGAIGLWIELACLDESSIIFVGSSWCSVT